MDGHDGQLGVCADAAGVREWLKRRKNPCLASPAGLVRDISGILVEVDSRYHDLHC